VPGVATLKASHGGVIRSRLRASVKNANARSGSSLSSWLRSSTYALPRADPPVRFSLLIPSFDSSLFIRRKHARGEDEVRCGDREAER
jgi:hypothetical protein